MGLSAKVAKPAVRVEQHPFGPEQAYGLLSPCNHVIHPVVLLVEDSDPDSSVVGERGEDVDLTRPVGAQLEG